MTGKVRAGVRGVGGGGERRRRKEGRRKKETGERSLFETKSGELINNRGERRGGREGNRAGQQTTRG